MAPTTMSHDISERRTDGITRIDSAHSPDSDKMPHAACVLAASAVVPATSSGGLNYDAERIRLHAEDLAEQLRSRQRELDLREAQLNGRLAEVENEQRIGRLCLQEHLHELAEREAELEQQRVELLQRIQEFTSEQQAAGEERQRQEQELRIRESQLAERENRLAGQLRQLAEEAETVRIQRDHLLAQKTEFEQALAAQLVSLELREKHFAEREAALHTHLEQLAQDQQAVAEQRSQWTCAMEDTRRKQEDRQTQLERAWAEAEREWDSCHQQLARRESELVRLHADALQLYQQASEARLVAEQLWARLSEKSSPSEMAKAADTLRIQRANHSRTSDELRQQCAAMLDLAQRLDAQAAALST